MQQFLSIVKKCYNFAKENIRIIVPAVFALVSVIAVIVSVNSCDLTVAYTFSYGDKTLCVRDTVDFSAAKTMIKMASATGDVENYIDEPVFTKTVAMRSQLDNVNSVAETIIENTDGIVVATILRVNGEYVACVEGETSLDEYLEKSRTRYDKDGSVSTFVDEITTEKAYYPKSQVKTLDEIIEVIDKLSVKTVSTVSGKYNVAYSTTVIKDKAKAVGYRATKTAGSYGVVSYTDEVTYVNGKESSRERLESKTIKQPSNEVIVVGTAAISGGNSFRWPLAGGYFYTMTSYYGDGRGHKGWDIAGSTGTPICASMSGVVTEASSGWNGGYGTKVVLDHGNGVKTVYAHCQKLYVKVGDVVTGGQVIATMGNTGRSTGPHLHFEININGSAVNPEIYLGKR